MAWLARNEVNPCEKYKITCIHLQFHWILPIKTILNEKNLKKEEEEEYTS